MAAMNLEKRIRALEGEVARLKQHLTATPQSPLPWCERIYGAFENDPAYDEPCGSDASTASRSDPAGRSQRRRSAAARAAMVILDTDHVSFCITAAQDRACDYFNV
jgi:hypothetical protein